MQLVLLCIGQASTRSVTDGIFATLKVWPDRRAWNYQNTCRLLDTFSLCEVCHCSKICRLQINLYSSQVYSCRRGFLSFVYCNWKYLRSHVTQHRLFKVCLLVYVYILYMSSYTISAVSSPSCTIQAGVQSVHCSLHVCSSNHPLLLFLVVCYGLGACYLKLSRLRDAEEAFSELVKIYKAMYPPGHPEIADGQFVHIHCNCFLLLWPILISLTREIVCLLIVEQFHSIRHHNSMCL